MPTNSRLSLVDPLPFEELFRPLVPEAEDELRRRVDAVAWELLTPEAHSDWSQYLLTRLTAAGSKAAHWQFQIYRTVHAAFAVEWQEGRQMSNALYRQFVGSQPKGRLQKLFDEFPALAILCSTLVKNWLTAVGEFLANLQTDYSGLSPHFPGGDFPCPIAGIQAGLSDPHRGGRCVIRIKFGDGESLIYKPRSLATERHFAAFLDQLNVEDVVHPLKSARCWDCGDHGWMEDIAPRPCSTVASVQAFYWRMGAQLGLVYLARGVDFHRENVIAAGEFPVLVDLEGLWHPQPAFTSRQKEIVDTVLGTGFLPINDSESGKAYEWGALGRQRHTDRTVAVWNHVNHDNMSVRTTIQTSRGYSHLPVLSGETHLATEYVSCIQSGFRWMGEYLYGENNRWSGFERWISALARCPRRLIPRPTARYQTALERITAPETLRQAQITTDALPGFTRMAGLESCESQMLAQMDVPYFLQTDFNPGQLDSSNLRIPSQDEYFAQIPVIARSLASNHPSSQASLGHLESTTIP